MNEMCLRALEEWHTADVHCNCEAYLVSDHVLSHFQTRGRIVCLCMWKQV